MSASTDRHLKSLIAANLRAAKLEKQLSIADLAERTGAHQRLILKWLKGDVTPSARYMLALALALDKVIPWFYEDHGYDVPEAA